MWHDHKFPFHSVKVFWTFRLIIMLYLQYIWAQNKPLWGPRTKTMSSLGRFGCWWRFFDLFSRVNISGLNRSQGVFFFELRRYPRIMLILDGQPFHHSKVISLKSWNLDSENLKFFWFNSHMILIFVILTIWIIFETNIFLWFLSCRRWPKL